MGYRFYKAIIMVYNIIFFKVTATSINKVLIKYCKDIANVNEKLLKGGRQKNVLNPEKNAKIFLRLLKYT